MNSGTIDLQSYILTANGDCQFVSGTIQNGKIVISGSITAKFKGTTFNAVVHVNANSVLLNGSVFNDSLTIIKNGSSGDLGKGGNTFYGVTSIENNGSGSLVLSDSLPDTFNSTLEANNASSGNIYLAHRGAGNTFNGKVTFKGSRIYSNYYGSANFNEDITLDTRSGEVYFGYASGSCALMDGKTITISIGGITSGVVYFRNFILQDTSKTLALNLTGTSQLYFENGCEIYATTNCSAPIVLLNGAHFYRSATFTNTGTIESTSVGGNYFSGPTTIKNYCSTPMVLTTGSTRTDTFANKAIFENVSGIVSVNNAYFADSVTLKNQNTSNSAVKFYISYSGNCFFKGPVTIDNNTSGMEFSKSGVNATTTLDTAATFIFKTGFSGNISLKNVITLGNTSHVFDFPSSNSKLILGPGSTFGGNVSFYGQSISLNGTKFNGNAELIKYGNASDTSKGSNEFNGTTTIIDSSSSGNLILAYNSADDFNGNVTFIQKGTNAKLYPAYNYNTTFSGSISIDGSSAINFSRSGKVIFDGSTAQSINNSLSYAPIFGKIAMNKSNNSLTLNTPLTVTDSLLFLKGNINADTTNYISLNNTGKIAGASDSSLVNGPFKKIGNSAFVFPIGFNGLHGYHPVEITAPASSSDSYTAQFIHQGQTLGNTLDSSIEHLNSCQYWRLVRNTGNSKVRIKLNWNYDYCSDTIVDPQYMRVVGWNSSIWKDFKSEAFSGDSIKGYTLSVDSSTTISDFTLANKRCIYFRDILTKQDVKCKGHVDGMAFVEIRGGTKPYNYSWSKSMGTQSLTPLLFPGKFIVNVKDSLNCQLVDSTLISEPDSLILNISQTPSTCGDSTGTITALATGGTGLIKKYFWAIDASTESTHSNLPAGQYTVMVKDSNECVVFKDVQLSDSDGPEINFVYSNPANCYGGFDGGAMIDITSGTEPYHIKWFSSPMDTLDYIENVRPGFYSVRVIDSIGCISYDTIAILEPDTFRVGVETVNTRCRENQGSATAIIVGGSGGYQYQWSISGSNDASINNLNSGEGKLIVTDSHGCVASANFEILDIDGLEITGEVISDAICFPDSGGTAFVQVHFGTAPYTYSWYPQGGTNDTAFRLPPDNYTVKVIDSDGCRQKTSLTIVSPEKLNAYIVPYTPSADTALDGAAFSIVYGGTAPYSYLWSNGATSESIFNLGVNSIDTLFVTDSHGCKVKNITKITRTSHICYEGSHAVEILNNCGPFSNNSCPTCSTLVEKNIIDDFGAAGDGYNNDECAFEAASDFFASISPIVPKKLIIPYGIYLVGVQDIPWRRHGNNVLFFNNMSNLVIEGQLKYNWSFYYGEPQLLSVDTPKIRYHNCMKYGSFDLPNSPDVRLLSCDFENPPICDDGTMADVCRALTPGTAMIHLNNCQNVTISNLDLDGNIDNMQIGGRFTEGIQLPYDGIFMNACQHVTINNVNTHHFGSDGIRTYFQQCPYMPFPNHLGILWPPIQFIPYNNPFTPHMDLTLNNCKSIYNGRDGLQWGGGVGLVANNCEFSYTGQGRFFSKYASGFEMEYEGNSNWGNRDGYLHNCKFRYNHISGFLCDAGKAKNFYSDYFSRDVKFESCIFVGSETGTAIWPNSRNFEFLDCEFYGRSWKAFSSPIPGSNYPNLDNTKFRHCFFSEEYVDPDILPLKKMSISVGHDLDQGTTNISSGCPNPSHVWCVEISAGLRILLEECTIETNFNLKTINLSTDPGILNPNLASYNVIDHLIARSYGLNTCGCDFHPQPGCEARELSAIYHVIKKNHDSHLNDWGPLRNPGSDCTPPSQCDRYLYYIDPLGSVVSDPANTTIIQITTCSQSFPWTCFLNTQANAPPWWSLSEEYYNPVHPKALDLYPNPSVCSTQTYFILEGLPFDNVCNPPILKKKNPNSPKEERIISLHPNPSMNILTVENAVSGNEINIYSIVGDLILTEKVNEQTLEIDISKLKPGVFILRSNDSKSYKFIKL
jgi:hypothetical protein